MLLVNMTLRHSTDWLMLRQPFGIHLISCRTPLAADKLKFHWDQFPRNFPVAKRGSRQLVTRKLRGSWRRRQQVREEVAGKLVPVEFELYPCSGLWPVSATHSANSATFTQCCSTERHSSVTRWRSDNCAPGTHHRCLNPRTNHYNCWALSLLGRQRQLTNELHEQHNMSTVLRCFRYIRLCVWDQLVSLVNACHTWARLRGVIMIRGYTNTPLPLPRLAFNRKQTTHEQTVFAPVTLTWT